MPTRDVAAGALLPLARGAPRRGRLADRAARWLGAGAAACVVGWGANAVHADAAAVPAGLA